MYFVLFFKACAVFSLFLDWWVVLVRHLALVFLCYLLWPVSSSVWNGA